MPDDVEGCSNRFSAGELERPAVVDGVSRYEKRQQPVMAPPHLPYVQHTKKRREIENKKTVFQMIACLGWESGESGERGATLRRGKVST